MTLFDCASDRPDVASSFLAVALPQVRRPAMARGCKERPQLAIAVRELELSLAALPCRGGELAPGKRVEPLGFTAICERHPMDVAFADWGPSVSFDFGLRTRARRCNALNQLHILVLVLDDEDSVPAPPMQMAAFERQDQWTVGAA